MKHIIKIIVNKCFLLCLGLLLVLTNIFFGFAESINFQDCYMPWEYGDSQKNYIYVRPHGSRCDKICENQCREFAQPSEFSSVDCQKRNGNDCLELSKSGIPNSLTGAQLNQDIIDDCVVKCRKGQIFSSQYRVKGDIDSNVFGWKWSDSQISTNTACDTSGETNDESVDFAYFPINFDVKQGDKVKFSLANSDSPYGNTIFLGGFETKRITPDYWYTQPGQVITSGSWNARVSQWYDTGIKLKDGDYLRVAYGGKFFGNYVGKDKGALLPFTSDKMYNPDKSDLDLTFNGSCFGDKDYFPGEELSTCYYVSDNKKSYCIDKNNQTIDCASGECNGLSDGWVIDNNSKDKQCFLRGTRSALIRKSLNINGWSASNIPLDKFEFQGYLNGYTSKDDTFQIKYKDDYIEVTQCNNSGTGQGKCTKEDHWPNCGVFKSSCCVEYETLYYQHCNTSVNGNLIRQLDKTVDQQTYDKGSTITNNVIQRDYSNNFGGYEVEISRKGSPYSNGDGLQYAIVGVVGDGKNEDRRYEPWDKNLVWKDAKDYVYGDKSDQEIAIDKDGKIYFRINPDLIKYGRESTLGSYGVIVNKKDTPSNSISNVISDIVNQVTTFFIGDDGNKMNSGKVQYIFNKLIQNPLIINGIRALLVLYLVYTGISYMIGFAQVSQKEAMNRTLKIAFVVMIISPNSWTFFNTYLFSTLLNGSMELTYDIVRPFTDIQRINVESATHSELVKAVFGMFDEIFHQLFNNAIWTKIWALTCTSLVGILIAILMIVAIISYLICALRVIVTYLYSMITLCVLFILAPIFISFMLFEKTSKLFRSWINNMISMVFQPLFAFTALAILHQIFVLTLHAALSFTACPTCLLSFDLFGYYLCLPWKNAWWVALYGAHFPLEASMSSPVNLLLPVFAVLIVVQAMDGMVRLASGFANKIATSSFYGFDLEAVAVSAQSYAGGMISKAANTVLGTGDYALKDRSKDKGDDKDNKKGDDKKGNSDKVQRK